MILGMYMDENNTVAYGVRTTSLHSVGGKPITLEYQEWGVPVWSFVGFRAIGSFSQRTPPPPSMDLPNVIDSVP